MKKCFVIMPITTPESIIYDKDHFKHILDYLIIPAIKKAELEPVPPIVKGAEVIHGEVIKNLEISDIVLCDMSSLNPNVFFELGIRTALNKSISLIKDDKTASIPFDTSIINYHTYRSGLNAWELEKDIADLSEHLKNSMEKSSGSSSLWRYFSLSIQAEPMKERQGEETKIDFLSLQMEGMRRQLESLTPKSDPSQMRDFAVDQNRSSVIADLTTLAAKAQKYYFTPASLTGGGNSFVGLTADASGLGQLASPVFTDNSNGTYTIKTAGTATMVVLHGVGKTALNDGTYPTYDMRVTADSYVATKIN